MRPSSAVPSSSTRGSTSDKDRSSVFNLPSELLSFLPDSSSSSPRLSQPPSPLLPRTRPHPQQPTPPSLPFRIPLSSRRLKVVCVSLVALGLIYLVVLRPTSRPHRPKYTVLPDQGDLGYPIDYTRSGQLGVLRPGTTELLIPEKPRNVLVDGLTDLGLEADRSYDIGIAASPDEYITTLRTFVRDAFPRHLQPRLLRSLERYWTGAEMLPAMIDSRTVWQTAKEMTETEQGKWTEKNDGWKWDLLGDEEADEWVKRTFAPKTEGEDKSVIEKGWDALGEGILRADALRYLLLLMEGGVYSDTDTTCLKPILQWGQNPTLLHGQPKSLLQAPPSVIIGVEADVGMREDWHQWWPRPLQIVQWTLTSAPHHPIFLDVLRRILIASDRAAVWTARRDALVRRLRSEGKGEEADKVQGWKVLTHKGADEDEEIRGEVGTGVSVMDWTGPGVWTDGVFAYLKARFDLSWPVLKDLREPLRIGELTVLPVTGFSPGVGMFGSEGISDGQAMVSHAFEGSWKESHG